MKKLIFGQSTTETIRSMRPQLFSKGAYYQIPASLLGGEKGDPNIKEEATSLAPLQGKIDHIYHIRNSVDRRASAEKKKNSTATRRLYHRFLFYKNFVALDKPLIIPEGKTDVVYLRAAITKLTAFLHRILARSNKASSN